MNDATRTWLEQGRFDRLDFLFSMESDRFAQLKLALEGTFAAVADEAGVPIAMSVRCLGASPSAGTRLYEVGTWGVFSEVLAKALPDKYWPNVSRVDFRVETAVESERLADFARYVEHNGQWGRNVNYFNTRERSKKEGRHAGGKGVSIGSHKSDTRAVVYKKKGEPGACEVQLSGEVLRKMVSAAMTVNAQFDWETTYSALAGTCKARLVKLLKQSGFETPDTFAAFITQPSDMAEAIDPVEYNIFSCKASFEALPAEAQKLLLNELMEITRARA